MTQEQEIQRLKKKIKMVKGVTVACCLCIIVVCVACIVWGWNKSNNDIEIHNSCMQQGGTLRPNADGDMECITCEKAR